jgi:hypothetical protein
MAGTQELLEFVVPDLNCALVDHDGRLPRPLPPSAVGRTRSRGGPGKKNRPAISPLHSPKPPLNRGKVKALPEY